MQQNYKFSFSNFPAKPISFQMKALKLLFVSMVFLSACGQKKIPEGIIDERKMVRVLADLHTIDGYMSSLMSLDTLRIAGNKHYAAVYKNYNIDKPVFEKSLKYYSMQPVLLDSMYSRVDNILKWRASNLAKIQEAKQKKADAK